MESLSLFLPAYNEAAVIADTVGKAQKVLNKLAIKEYEIIVVNDGSNDKTGVIADQLAKQKNIRAIHHKHNQGYGAALNTGFDAARLEWIAFIDSDGQFNFADITKFLPLVEQNDAILGYRINRQDSNSRKLNAFAWGVMMKTIFNFQVRDIDCAFKLIRKSIVQQALPLSSSGAFVSTELIVKLKDKKAKIAEVGVTHHPRVGGESTGANLTVIKTAFVEMAQLRNQLRNK